MLTEDELDMVTRSVNDAILVNYPVEVAEERYRQAVNEGVIALFGEKYGDVVRVLRIGWPGEPFSQELCGGTHVDETGEIGLFHIVSEGGIGAGVRRIEAVTGRAAVDLVERQLGILRRTSAYLGVPPDEVDRKSLGLLDELQSARKEVARLQEQLARREFEALLDQVQTVAGASLLSTRVAAPSMEVLTGWGQVWSLWAQSWGNAPPSSWQSRPTWWSAAQTRSNWCAAWPASWAAAAAVALSWLRQAVATPAS